MREMTKKFLEDAFAGESMAHMKYLIFAEEAEKKGLTNLAKLFKAIAYAEFVHARNHYTVLGKVGGMPDNIQQCINGENFEVNEMYPVYKETAKMQNENDAVRSTHYALEAEKIHEVMYRKAKQLVEEGKDYPEVKIYICSICGHTVEGSAPEKCPVCGSSREKYVEF
ncbi:rubrerythrin family protein [Pseudothermotoga thermarum]|uniref:Rubrerythrin n=1 Tax=Pseudothermotoga thermarum DSM 5069 TaxID=688269 RepID=F7YU83_9THEM|nr:rubrerythrin family protein [Pseudothermotoga thermarum]AEH50179.1 Rubrerythrin [Pseudothermotoga thermarum DSM 5069]